MQERKLEMMVFHITPVCENRCEYCYMGNTLRNIHPQYYKIEKVLRELSEQGVGKILLGGGNPCTYPDLRKIVELGDDLGFSMDIISNTLHFEDTKTPKSIQGFDATILGSKPKSHDQVARKGGAYKRLVGNIKKLSREGLRIGIVLNATPQTYNKLFETVENLIEKEGISPLSINYIMIQRIIPKGRASDTMKYGLKRNHIDPLFEDLEKIEQTYALRIIFEDPFPACLVKERFHKYLSICVWGFTKGSIDWMGNVSRCGADSRFQLGNIFENPLKEIWSKSPTLLSFRGIGWMPLECVRCPNFEKCRCGCSLSNITESDHEPDILCPHCGMNSERFIKVDLLRYLNK